jgi:hypothetical protein
MTEKLPAVTDENFTSNFLKKIKDLTLAGAEGVTGLAESGKKGMILSSGRLFQSLINREFLDTLQREWDDLRSKGRIKDDYQQTEQHHACLQEMLDFLDTDKPDKIRFEFIKKIFLSAATETEESRDSVLPQQYMSIARQMTSGDVLLLSGLYDMYTKEVHDTGSRGVNAWIQNVAAHTPLQHGALVRFHEKHLMKLELVSERTGTDKSGMRRADHNRLSTMALSLCEFIAGYDALESDDQP